MTATISSEVTVYSLKCSEIGSIGLIHTHNIYVSGCGSGVICPVEQEGTAYCNRCNFDQSSYKCGSYTTKKSESSSYSPRSDLMNDEKLCETVPVKVYTGMDLQYSGISDDYFDGLFISKLKNLLVLCDCKQEMFKYCYVLSE